MYFYLKWSLYLVYKQNGKEELGTYIQCQNDVIIISDIRLISGLID